MKKLLGILGVISLIATTGATVVACGTKDNTSDTTKTIALSSNTSSLEIGTTASVTVTNASELTDLTVKSGDETYAKAKIASTTGVITIEGIAKGTATITVSSSNASDVSINVTVNEKTIVLSSDAVSIGAGKTSEVTVTNFSDLTDLTVKSNGEKFAKATIVATNGVITIEGIANGSTTITVSATNASDAIISVSVKGSILVSDSTLTIASETSEVQNKDLKVMNFGELSNLQVVTENTTIISSATVDQSTGVITFTVAAGGTELNVAGKALLTISADNYDNVQITVQVTTKPVLSISSNSVTISPTGSTEFSILNYLTLGDISFFFNSSTNYATYSYNSETGVMKITGSDNGSNIYLMLLISGDNVTGPSNLLVTIIVE